jgi:sortase A
MRVSKARRRLEKLLLVVGLAGVAIWVGSIVRTSVSQDWANWAFERKLHGQPATVSEYLASRLGPRTNTKPPVAEERPSTPTPPAPTEKPPNPPAIGTGEMIGRLAIPRLKLHAVVREGAGGRTLDLALGHIPGTALPGQTGNVGVAGHRDTLFRGLGEIRKTDRIEFQTLSGNYEYEVESTSIVKPQKVSVLDAGQYPEITLVTCYPFHYVGSAPDRFIVKARLVSPNLVSQNMVTQSPPPSAPAADPVRPVADAVEPVDPVKPVTDPVKPAADPVKPVADPVKPASVPVKPASVTEHHRPQPSAKKVFFHLSEGQSRTLVSGISLGLQWTDATRQRMNGWMWVAPDRRTIWLTRQHLHQPLVFYGHQDGKRRELVITRIGKDSVSGYLQL